MEIEEIKNKLRKSAVAFQTGGARPEDSRKQSWIGRVYLAHPGEVCPLDRNQKPMFPLMQLCLVDLPFVPPILQNTKLLTVFISSEFFEIQEGNFCVREYSSLEDLEEKDFGKSMEGLKPLPLFPQTLENSYPVWDSSDIPEDLAALMLEMEEEGRLDYFEDICEENDVRHKIGGYADYCQTSEGFDPGYAYVFQIVSDPKAGLDIGDSGGIYFAKNPVTNQWQADWDCY